jgi:hypothetical protein
MDEYQALANAYRILAGLYSKAWANPAEVPMQIALMLLHAREYVGAQIRNYFSSEAAAVAPAALLEPAPVAA